MIMRHTANAHWIQETGEEFNTEASSFADSLYSRSLEEPLRGQSTRTKRRVERKKKHQLLTINHKSISTYHAVVVFNTEGQPFIYDLKSRNGTFCNKSRVNPRKFHQLFVGDRLSFGKSDEYYVVHGPGDAQSAGDSSPVQRLKPTEVLKPGTTVVIIGLEEAPELNGTAAKIIKFNEEFGRYSVKPLSKGKSSGKISVPRKAVIVPKAVPIGAIVEMRGLENATTLNGRAATVVRYDAAKNAYTVTPLSMLYKGHVQRVALKRHNLCVVGVDTWWADPGSTTSKEPCDAHDDIMTMPSSSLSASEGGHLTLDPSALPIEEQETKKDGGIEGILGIDNSERASSLADGSASRSRGAQMQRGAESEPMGALFNDESGQTNSSETGWRKELHELLSSASTKEQIDASVMKWAELYYPATPISPAGDLPAHLLCYIEEMVVKTDKLFRKHENVLHGVRFKTALWMLIDFWVDIVCTASFSADRQLVGCTEGGDTIKTCALDFGGLLGCMCTRNIAVWCIAFSVVVQVTASYYASEHFFVGLPAVVGLKPLIQTMMIKHWPFSNTDDLAFGMTGTIDLIFKTIPMALLIIYSIIDKPDDGWNELAIKLLGLWISVWVASDRYQDGCTRQDAHKQSARLFPEYFGLIPKSPLQHAICRMGLKAAHLGILSSKLLALGCLWHADYMYAPAWLMVEFILALLASTFILKNGTRAAKPATGAAAFILERFLTHLSLVFLPWPSLRVPGVAGAGVWSTFILYSNFISNPAMLAMALYLNGQRESSCGGDTNMMDKHPELLAYILLATTSIAVLAAIAVWRYIDPAFRDTFKPWKNVTLRAYLSTTFDTRTCGKAGRGESLDVGRAWLVEQIHHYYWPMAKVQVWLSHSWKKWEEDRPSFFTRDWRDALVKNAPKETLPEPVLKRHEKDNEKREMERVKRTESEFFEMMKSGDTTTTNTTTS